MFIKKTIFIWATILMLVLSLTSCKKDSAPPSNNSNGTIVITTSQPSSTTVFTGLLGFNQVIEYTKSPFSLGIGNSFDAYFSYAPTYYQNPATYFRVDSINANNFPLSFSSSTYTNATSQIVNTPIVWKIFSHSYIPSFIFTNCDSLPTYSGYSLLPDTISLSSGTTLNFTGLNNMDSLSITIEILSGSLFAPQTYFLPKNSHSFNITFTGSFLTALGITPTQLGSIAFSVQRVVKRKIAGKDYSFTTGLRFTKYPIVLI